MLKKLWALYLFSPSSSHPGPWRPSKPPPPRKDSRLQITELIVCWIASKYWKAHELFINCAVPQQSPSGCPQPPVFFPSLCFLLSQSTFSLFPPGLLLIHPTWLRLLTRLLSAHQCNRTFYLTGRMFTYIHNIPTIFIFPCYRLEKYSRLKMPAHITSLRPTSEFDSWNSHSVEARACIIKQFDWCTTDGNTLKVYTSYNVFQ